MSGEIVYRRGPCIARRWLPFARSVSEDGIGWPEAVLRFRREVLDIRHCEAEAWIVLNGRPLDLVSGYTDAVYGFMSSAESAIADARAKAAELAVGPDGPVALEVYATLVTEPLTAAPDGVPPQLGTPAYRTVPKDWLVDDETLPRYLAERAKPWPQRDHDIRPTTLGETKTTALIWSSRSDDAENRQRLGTFRALQTEIVAPPAPE